MNALYKAVSAHCSPANLWANEALYLSPNSYLLPSRRPEQVLPCSPCFYVFVLASSGKPYHVVFLLLNMAFLTDPNVLQIHL